MGKPEPWASSPVRRRIMQSNRSRDTAPELAVRRLLHTRGPALPRGPAARTWYVHGSDSGGPRRHVVSTGGTDRSRKVLRDRRASPARRGMRPGGRHRPATPVAAGPMRPAKPRVLGVAGPRGRLLGYWRGSVRRNLRPTPRRRTWPIGASCTASPAGTASGNSVRAVQKHALSGHAVSVAGIADGGPLVARSGDRVCRSTGATAAAS